MKKIWDFMKTYILGFAEDKLLDEGGQALEKALEAFREKKPEIADALVVNLYMLITTVGKDVVVKTENPYDDHAVAEVLAEVKEYAERHGITLPEIDKEEKPNDQ